MKPLLAVFALAAPPLLLPPFAQAGAPVTFELTVDPTGVAMQFDVFTAGQSLSGIGSPTFEGTSAHTVKSAPVANGSRRFVIYSLDGDPISQTGRVTVLFPSAFQLGDGVVNIGNVVASDASGDIVTANPDAIPMLTRAPRSHQSVVTDETVQFPQAVVDLDGAIKQLRLIVDDSDVDTADAQPFDLAWTPLDSGAYTLRLAATDSADRLSEFNLGVFRAYAHGDIASFGDFASIHYGEDGVQTQGGFDQDPLGTGLPNGLAYLLGLNPHTPERSRLPSLELEEDDGQAELVLRFVRRTALADVSWSARASNDLRSFGELPSAARTIESDLGDGSTAVEIRLPTTPDEDYRQFLNIRASQL